MAYELLTGVVPWRNSNNGMKLVAQIVSPESAPSLSTHAGVPPELATVVDRALRKAPGERFSSMDLLVAALESLGALTPTTARSAPAPRPSRVWRRGLVVAAVSVAVVVAAMVARRHANPAPVAATPAPSAPGPVKMTDVALPATSNPEAVAAYRRELQSMHDADFGPAYSAMQTAVSKDPALGAAYVPICALPAWPQRPYCAAARRLLTTLSERDAAIVDAVEPSLVPGKPDLAASADRAVALAARYPNDAWVALVAANALYAARRDPEALYQRAVALDPTFALALRWRAHTTRSEQDAIASYEACLRVAPSSGTCMRELAGQKAREGDCAAADVLTRRNVSVEPDGFFALASRFNALLAGGASRADSEAVARLVASHATRATADENLTVARAMSDVTTTDDLERMLRAVVAIQYGAFSEADAMLRGAHTSSNVHGKLMQLAAETGDAAHEGEEASALIADSRERRRPSPARDESRPCTSPSGPARSPPMRCGRSYVVDPGRHPHAGCERRGRGGLLGPVCAPGRARELARRAARRHRLAPPALARRVAGRAGVGWVTQPCMGASWTRPSS